MEFEPVKRWEEITEKYNPEVKVEKVCWVEVELEVTDEKDSYFMPSVYGVEILRVLRGPREALEAERLVSYVEEFRMQVKEGEKAVFKGWLERVVEPKRTYYQLTASYGPSYFQQLLKKL